MPRLCGLKGMALLFIIAMSLPVLSSCTPRYTQQQVVESQTIQYGPGFFLYRDKTIPEDSAMRVFYYKPSSFSEDSPIFFLLHGYGREADKLLYATAVSAETFNFLLIVPEYSFKLYPTWEEYNYGNARKKTKEFWTYFVNDRIFHFIKRLTHSKRDKYLLFGHSAGAQFVHRQLMVGASNFIDKAFAANAGEYAMPTNGKDPFPWSMSGLELSTVDISNFFSADLYVLLGEEDVVRDKYFAKGGHFENQGRTRFERGNNFYNIGRREAMELGLAFHWKLGTVPHVGHSALGTLPTALRIAFSEPE